MAKTFQIDDSIKGAQELLAYLRSLSFVKEIEHTDSSVLTEEHLQILNERRTKYLNGEDTTYSIDEVESFARNSIK